MLAGLTINQMQRHDEVGHDYQIHMILEGLAGVHLVLLYSKVLAFVGVLAVHEAVPLTCGCVQLLPEPIRSWYFELQCLC